MGGRLLLAQAVQRAENPDQVHGVDADHRAVAEQLTQDPQGPAVLRIFAITGLDDVIPQFASLDDALAAAPGGAELS